MTLTLIFVLCLSVFTLTACQDPHVHTYATEYIYDETRHWQQATCGCDLKQNFNAHEVDDSGYCIVCDAPIGATVGIVYDISADGTYAEVIGYEGSATRIVIASEYEGKPVKTIYDSAFKSSYSITQVTIPDSVTSIGSSAFSGCYSLTSIEIPSSVTSIGECAFSSCDNLTSVTFGENSQLTSIGERAFCDSDSLTSIEIPASVTSIGFYAFSGCYRLVEVINKSEHITVTKGSSDNGLLGYHALSVSNREDNYVSKLSTDANGFVIYTEGEEKY